MMEFPAYGRRSYKECYAPMAGGIFPYYECLARTSA